MRFRVAERLPMHWGWRTKSVVCWGLAWWLLAHSNPDSGEGAGRTERNDAGCFGEAWPFAIAGFYIPRMPSFDVVCKLDHHEVDNSIDQANRELKQRFDFKGTESTIEKTDEGIVIRSNSEGRLDAARDVLESKAIRRKVSLKSLDAQKAQPAGGQMWRQLIKLREGIDKDAAKLIVRKIKDAKLKVQAAIQGDVVRVTGKKRDDLQQVIAMLREEELELPLSYVNFRD